MKKIVIVGAKGGELANQLWNYTSVYAYCLEKEFDLKNPAFFEYGNYFRMPKRNLFFRLFFFLPFTNYTKRKRSFKRRLWRKVYSYYAYLLLLMHNKSALVLDPTEHEAFYLPPTRENERLSMLEASFDIIYFDGWLFRNPLGLQKFRKEILKYFKPRADIEQEIQRQVQELRSRFTHIVGVHIRQGDYRAWRGGAYFIPQGRVRELLNEYLERTGHTPSNTSFIITSDGPIDASLFTGLSVSISKGSAVHDLFLLSTADAVIGANSTFGAFASYYGNIPFIVMQKEPMDWEYYSDKRSYFENKYSTFVQY
jgi:hypothetical protein